MNKLKIYVAEANKLSSSWSESLKLLNPARQKKVLALKHREDQLRSLAGGLLLHRFLGITRDEEVSFEPQGRPYLTHGGPFFSLSHSGHYTALSVGNNLHGLDLERLRPNLRNSLHRRVLTTEEYEFFEASGNDPEVFLSFWTLKESIMKATGEGLGLDPASFSVLPLDEIEHHILGRPWFNYQFKLPGHQLSLSTTKPVESELVKADDILL